MSLLIFHADVCANAWLNFAYARNFTKNFGQILKLFLVFNIWSLKVSFEIKKLIRIVSDHKNIYIP